MKSLNRKLLCTVSIIAFFLWSEITISSPDTLSKSKQPLITSDISPQPKLKTVPVITPLPKHTQPTKKIKSVVSPNLGNSSSEQQDIGRQALPHQNLKVKPATNSSPLVPVISTVPQIQTKIKNVPSKKGGFLPKELSTTNLPATESSPSLSSQPHITSGFVPTSNFGDSATIHNVLSADEIQRISMRTGQFESLKRTLEEAKRRAEERIQRLEHEAYISGADCDDTDSDINPGRLEICDHKDNNCDGRVDEGQTILAYADLDGDGHGDISTELEVCYPDISAGSSVLSTLSNDCDDTDPDHWHDCPTTAQTE